MGLHWVRDGAIVLGVELVVAALGAECLGAFDACFADPTCFASSSTSPIEEFFGTLAVGIAVFVAGAVQLDVGLRVEPVASPF